MLAGQSDFAIASSDIILDRMTGKPVVALAAITQTSPGVLLVRADSGIRTPLDLVGKRMELSESAEILAMLQKEGIDSKKINIQPGNIEVNLDDLVNGKTDAYFGYLTNEAYQLKIKGVAYRAINPRDYGVDFYNDVLITSERLIHEHPNRVKAFRLASLKGWEYALTHMNETVRFIHQRYAPNKSLDQLNFEVRELYKLIMPDIVEIGHMNPERWRRIGETYAELGMMKLGFDQTGFLYDPNPPPKDLTWLYLLLAGALAAMFTAPAISCYIYCINRRLTKSLSLQLATLESTHDAILVVDLDNSWVLYNHPFIDMWHITDELLASGDDSVASSYVMDQVEDKDDFLNKVHELCAAPEAGSLDIFKLKDGKTIECYCMPQFIDGKVVGRVWSFRDITEIKRAQADLKLAKEAAEAILVEQRQFVAMISHEYRSPLAVIDSATQLLGIKLSAESDVLPILARIRRGVSRLTHFIDNCMTEDRLDSGALTLLASSIDLNAFAASVTENAHHITEIHPIITELAPDLPPLDADPQLLGIMLLNLLSNAIKYSPAGSEIRLRITHADQDCRFEVFDRGQGIPAEDLPLIFKKYTRGRASTSVPGAGLGLSLVSRIVALHGGSVKIESIEGDGSHVTILIPLNLATAGHEN